MNRRILTLGIGAIAILLVISTLSPLNGQSDGKIIDQKILSNEEYNSTNNRLPIVKFKPDKNQIVITSVILTGSKECTHPTIQNTTFNPTGNSLRIELGSEPDNDLFQFQCPAVAVVGTYDITLTVRNELPTTVTVDNSRDTTSVHNPSRCRTVSHEGENRTVCWSPNEANQSSG